MLYLGTSALDSDVIGWSRYDGTGRSRPTMGDSDEPPYATGLEALLDGWRLIQMSQLLTHERGHEYDTAYLPYEFVFERLVDLTDLIEAGWLRKPLGAPARRGRPARRRRSG